MQMVGREKTNGKKSLFNNIFSYSTSEEVPVYRAYIRLKACPRCRGDILVDKAFEDSDVCLQCGFRGQVKPAYHVHLPGQKREKEKQTLKS